MPELMERLAHQLRQVKAAKERLEAESQALASILAEVSTAAPDAGDAEWEKFRRLNAERSEAVDALRLARATSALEEFQRLPRAGWSSLGVVD